MDGMNGLLDFAKTPEGQGLLAAVAGGLAGARRGTPVNNLGRAGLAGVAGYGNALQTQGVQELRDLQMKKAAADTAEMQRKRDAQAAYRNTLPADQQQLFDVAPDKLIENLPQFQKPQLVEVADPTDPLRTQKMWMKPGESQGTIAGYGAMPEILDPRVQAAKRAIAKAGASNVNVNTKQETEESKEVGKGFGKQYLDLQSAGFEANNKIARLDRLSNLMSGVQTGKLEPSRMQLAAVAESLGMKFDPNLGSKQAIEAISNEMALQARNPAGGAGMPGALSDKDREFLTNITPGMSKTPEGNRMIMQTSRKLAQRDKDVARIAREYRKRNGTIDEGFYDELGKFSEANPLFPKAQESAPPAGKTLVYDPATGTFH
jgi:hypothetical protein